MRPHLPSIDGRAKTLPIGRSNGGYGKSFESDQNLSKCIDDMVVAIGTISAGKQTGCFFCFNVLSIKIKTKQRIKIRRICPKFERHARLEKTFCFVAVLRGGW